MSSPCILRRRQFSGSSARTEQAEGTNTGRELDHDTAGRVSGRAANPNDTALGCDAIGAMQDNIAAQHPAVHLRIISG